MQERANWLCPPAGAYLPCFTATLQLTDQNRTMFYCHQAGAVTRNRTAGFCDELQEVLRLLMDLVLPLYGQQQEGIAAMKAICMDNDYEQIVSLKFFERILMDPSSKATEKQS